MGREQHAVGNCQEYFIIARPSGVTNWDATTVTVGQPFFVVVRLQIVATNGVSYYTNDEVDLWINPAANTFGTNEANVPAPDAISPPGDGAPPSSSHRPGTVFYRITVPPLI